jgi:predicted outer membrane repeat protein
VNCLIAGNRSNYSIARGAGVYGGHRSVVHVRNSIIVGNESADSVGFDSGVGGAIATSGDMLTIDNCTITQNRANGSGGAVYTAVYSNAVVRNSILWGNTSPGSPLDFETPAGAQIGYSALPEGLPQGSIDLGGNILADPAFVDADGPDNSAETWADNDYRLQPESPCIDAGDNTAVPFDFADLDRDGNTTERLPVDIAGQPRFIQYPFAPDTGRADPPAYRYVVDMGAHEFSFCFGDLNQDGSVGLADLSLLLANFGRSANAAYYEGDLDGDRDVDIRDLTEMLSLLSTGPCP